MHSNITTTTQQDLATQRNNILTSQRPSTMSVPIAIVRSNSSSKSALADLLHFRPSSPNYACERHACAFPAWPDRPTLNSPDLSAACEDSGFFSDMDLAGHSLHMTRTRSRPSNYLELEFEEEDDDDSSDNSSAVSLSSTPEAQRKSAKNGPVKRCDSKSIIANELRRERTTSSRGKKAVRFDHK